MITAKANFCRLIVTIIITVFWAKCSSILTKQESPHHDRRRAKGTRGKAEQDGARDGGSVREEGQGEEAELSDNEKDLERRQNEST